MKTLQQIHEQSMRLYNKIAASHWDGKEYFNCTEAHKKLMRIKEIRNRYIDAAYRHYGHNTDGNGIATSGKLEDINRLWSDTPIERKIYAGY